MAPRPLRGRGPLRGSVLAVAALLLGGPVLGGLVLGAPAPAEAAQGTVPPEVAAFVSGQLIDGLDDAYGPRKGGTTDFHGASRGPITEVWFFTEDSRSGRDVTDPVIPRQQWAVPIDLAGVPAGCAIVAFDPDSDLARVDGWDPDPGLATAVTALAPSATLVRDQPTSSWFSVADGIATPLVTGTSEITRPRPLSGLDLDRVPPRIDAVNPATVRALAALVALTGVGLLATSIPRLVARSRARRTPPAP